MATKISEVNTLKAYLEGVLDRAGHHAGEVGEIALAIAGAVIWRKDADDLQILERSGKMKNVLWVKIGGRRHVLSYNHVAKAIELRQDTLRGRVVAAFDNRTPISKVKSVFGQL